MKISEYLIQNPNTHRVLLIFDHGLGDALMFFAGPFRALKSAFPRVIFSVSTHCGQEEVFGNFSRNQRDYDATFTINFPCSEWDAGSESKPQKCARTETGIAFHDENYSEAVKKYNTPLFGFHFHSTCLAGLRCPKDFAKKMWEQSIEEGLIPFDTHMRHCHDNLKDVFDFEKGRNVEGIKATLPKLLGLMHSFCGFAGVASGNFFSSLTALPYDKVMFIKTEFNFDKLTKLPVWQIDASKPYDRMLFHDFCQHIKETK